MRNKKDVPFALHCSDPSLCKIEFAKDADLNYVVKRFLSSGQLPSTVDRQPLQGDFSSSPDDFAMLMNQTVQARQAWEAQSVEFRNQFHNDFETYLDCLEAALKESAEKSAEKLTEKPVVKPAEQSAEQPAEKTVEDTSS